MVAGRLPFEGASALDTMHALAFEPAAPVTSIRGDMPWSLQKVIDRCLQKKAEDRYQDMREAVADLRNVKREIDSGVTSGAPASRAFQGMDARVDPRDVAPRRRLGLHHRSSFIALCVILHHQGLGRQRARRHHDGALGAWIYRRFRNRRQREMRRFVKKASGMREVRLVSFARGQFTVVALNPTARTYVKLNALHRGRQWTALFGRSDDARRAREPAARGNDAHPLEPGRAVRPGRPRPAVQRAG
jgi:hypothetical protein